MRVKGPVHGMVPVAILLDPEITLADLKVYTALASFQGSNDDSYPSRDAIVERCGAALETVSRSVKHLVELGWIERDRRGLNKTNIYRVLVEVSEVTPRSLPGSDSQVTPEVTPRSLPSIEQKEHLKERTPSLFGEAESKEPTEAEKLATLLLTEHRKLDSVFAKGKESETVQRWAKDIDKLIRLDGRSVEDVRSVILFSQASDFWCANIASGAKLRKQFDTLIIQSKRVPKMTPLFPESKEEPYVDKFAERWLKNHPEERPGAQ
jgi:Helix-turn-helix domain